MEHLGSSKHPCLCPRIESLFKYSTKKNKSKEKILIFFYLFYRCTLIVWQHGSMPRPAPGTGIKVNFVKPNGETVTVEANEGESLLDLARATDMDVEGKPGWPFFVYVMSSFLLQKRREEDCLCTEFGSLMCVRKN